MRQQAWLSLLCGAACCAACVVKSFDVEPESTANGGGSNGGTKAGSGQGGSGQGGSGNAAGTSSSSEGGNGTSPDGSAGVAGTDIGAGGDGQAPTRLGPRNIGHSEFHDSASADDTGSSHLADATFAKPSGTAPGDLMLVFFGCDHKLMNLNGSQLEASGWTLLDQHEEVGTDGQGTYLLYHFVDGSEPDNIVFQNINNLPYGNGVQGLLTVYRGVNLKAPVNAYEVFKVDTGSDGTKHIETATPAITTTTDHCLLIAGLSPDSAVDRPLITAWPDGFDENQVSVVNPPTPYPNGWANIYSAERLLPQAGTVAASRFAWDISYDGSQYYGALSFVLALAPQ